MVGITERLRSEPLPGGERHDMPAPGHPPAKCADMDGPDFHWANSALPLLSRWLLALTKDRLAKAAGLRPGET